MSRIRVGDMVSLRLGWWDDYQTVTAVIRKRFWFFYLVTWGVRESWDGTPPFSHYSTTKWRPSWRLISNE